MWQLAGLQFHLYGLLIAAAILVGYFLVERKATLLGWSTHFLEQQLWLVVLSGVVGARLYHVISDFYLYQDQLLNVFKIWQGGLSIIGAVMGAGLGLALAVKLTKPQHSLLAYLDLAIFGLPLAQALGRLGNYFNQELYGLPTSLPWAIYIPPAKRLLGWEEFNFFHPLFAYEMILLTLFGIGVWWISAHFHKTKWAKVGSGWYFLTYLAYYCVVRIMLDFLRLDKHLTSIVNLGSNQVALLIGLFLILVVALYRGWKQHET